ncbi:hypothetical protein RJ641_012169 [Dillenia turbinata]|uniref:Uncharacterized protein n=1 Tax=Dillenia turbinata TaxID=194707 RepID=A0AAN8Z237_9MAGN
MPQREIIPGGFLAALIPVPHVGDGPSHIDAFESCFIHMAKEADVAIVIGYHIQKTGDYLKRMNGTPSTYLPTLHQKKSLRSLYREMDTSQLRETRKLIVQYHQMRAVPPDASKQSVKRFANQTRSDLEGLIKEHFGVGNEVMDELFDRYAEKLIESGSHTSFADFVLLKCKVQA